MQNSNFGGPLAVECLDNEKKDVLVSPRNWAGKMIIELKKLTDKTLRIRRSISIGSQRQPIEGCFYSAPVSVDLILVGKDQEFRLTGSVKAPLICISHRSLRTFEKLIEETVDTLYVPADELPEDLELELDDEDANVQAVEDTLDLNILIDEIMNLAMPMHILAPDEERQDESAFRTARDETGGEEQIDERLQALVAIKERMLKQSGK